MSESKINQAKMDADMKAAIDVHQRIADFAKEMVAEGIEPGIICHAMITTGTDGLLQAFGHEHAMNALEQCYAPIKNAVVHDAGKPPATRQ